jgi:hypothetical protein
MQIVKAELLKLSVQAVDGGFRRTPQAKQNETGI